MRDNLQKVSRNTADPSARAVQGVGLRPRACWDCDYESRRRYGCLSVVSVVCCQVEVSATNRSLVQRSPTDCGASLCVIKKPRNWGAKNPLKGFEYKPRMGCVAERKKIESWPFVSQEVFCGGNGSRSPVNHVLPLET